MDSIYQDFLRARTHKEYSTGCDLRESGEPFGIAGLETQANNLIHGA
ncbi:MAG: hypothetical protein IJ438_08255 [Clostridia bacterium]|nr:hypothetical protein [Clostridia bacterium]